MLVILRSIFFFKNLFYFILI